ncbi:predicted protein [Naegleria gruberi]|uniref:Predicted protein n=1 Tax=Naegleria gruberi TaxID=5762 RepID=D2V4B3_NAEGR|nr:uncharacterized protein NAEGRDRAFT_63663 [Naegleria gruberi]EFC48486.1 predicted protein [Naegleria gruberi]|eukprot:XP_002681230.1 predicted protein [Naegleria gruberi strain NEG-M]
MSAEGNLPLQPNTTTITSSSNEVVNDFSSGTSFSKLKEENNTQELEYRKNLSDDGSVNWSDLPFTIYSSESVNRCKPSLLMESSERIQQGGEINDNYIGVIPEQHYRYTNNNGLFFVHPIKNQHTPTSQILDNFYLLHSRAKLQQSFIIVGGRHQVKERKSSKFFMDEVFWLSIWDSKLVPCPKFTRFNLESIDVEFVERVDARDNEYMFFVVNEGDREKNCVKLSGKFETILSQCFSFPIHSLYTNFPPVYESLRERNSLMGDQFNCLIEKEDWFKDNLHSHIILQRYFKPIEITETQTEAEKNLAQLLQDDSKSWLDPTLERLPKYNALRESQDRKYSTTCVQKGVEFSKQKNYTKALDLYKEALDYDDKNIDAFIGIGSALYNQKSYQLASDNFQKAHQLDPNHPIPIQYLEKTKVKIEQALKERIENENKRKFAGADHQPQPTKSIHAEVEQTLSKLLHTTKKQRSCSESEDINSSSDSALNERWNAEIILEILKQHYPHLLQPDAVCSQYILEENSLWDCSVDSEELTGGVENDSVKITISFSGKLKNGTVFSTPKVCYIFRIYNDRDKSKEFIGFELSTLFFLCQNRFPVPFVILPTCVLVEFVQSSYSKFPDMNRVIVDFVDGRFCAMFSCVSGYHVDKGKKTIDQVNQLAVFLGSLHKMTRENGFSILDRKVTPQDMIEMKISEKKLTFSYLAEALESVSNTIQAMKSRVVIFDKTNCTFKEEHIEKANRYNAKVITLLDELIKIVEEANSLISTISKEEQQRLEDSLPQAILHADIHENNVLFSKYENKEFIAGVVDWDDSFWGPQILDFIKGFFFWCIAKIVTPEDEYKPFEVFDDTLTQAYRTSYENARGEPITQDEKKAMIPFSKLIMCAQIDFFVHAGDAEELFIYPDEDFSNGIENRDLEPFFALTWFTRVGREIEAKISQLLY